MPIQKFLNPEYIIKQVAISENSIVADFGAGLGKYAEKISSDVGSQGKVYIIEIQKDVLGRVKNDFEEKGIKNVEYINADLEYKNGSKIKDGIVDVVVIASVLFQSLKKEEIIKEAMRILTPNGRILIVEWKACFSGIGPDEELIFKEENSLEMMKNYPVKLERTLDAGDYHYAYLFRKI